MTLLEILLLVIGAILLLKFGFAIIGWIIGFLLKNIIWIILLILIIVFIFC